MKGMKDARRRAVLLASQEEIFRAMGYAALKARAGQHSPGEIITIGRFEMVVVEDEEGDGIVVQIIETRQEMEDLAPEAWDDRQRREWTDAFLEELGKAAAQVAGDRDETGAGREPDLREGGGQAEEKHDLIVNPEWDRSIKKTIRAYRCVIHLPSFLAAEETYFRSLFWFRLLLSLHRQIL